MMSRHDEATSIHLALPQSELDRCFRREVKWPQAFRVGTDSRLLLLALHRLFEATGLSRAGRHHAATYLGCRYGAQECYGEFDQALSEGRSNPLAYAYALPSIPLACASLLFQMRGQTYTVVGPQAGVQIADMAATSPQTGHPIILAALSSPAHAVS
ncbi:hypothetical protein RA19_24840, partial [Leisingera sp. ANG-M1]